MKGKILTHNGYEGSVDIDLEAGVMHGRILFIKDLVTYEATTVQELKAAFEEAVEDYLEECRLEGVEPNKPLSGTFNVRIGKERHLALTRVSIREGQSLNEIMCRAVDGFLKHDGKPKSVTHNHVNVNLTVDSSASLKLPPSPGASAHRPLTYNAPLRLVN